MNQSSEVSNDCRALPPLRVHHLVVVTALVAVMLTWWKLSLPSDARDQISMEQHAPALVLFVAGQVLSACGIAFAVLSLVWQARGHRAFVEPGQYLLLSFLILPLRMLWGLLYYTMRAPVLPWSKNILLWTPLDLLQVLLLMLAVVVAMLPAALFAWCAWRVADTRAWRVVFSIFAVRYFFGVFLSGGAFFVWGFGWSMQFSLAATSIARAATMLVLVLWATFDERRRTLRRVWTHWLGAGLFAVMQMLDLVSGVLLGFGWF